MKYSNTSKNDCSPIFCELSVQDFTFSETHKSRRNECFRDVRSQVCTYNEMVWQVIDAVKPECAYDIIIDSSPVSAMDNLLWWYERRLEEGERIDWFEIRSSSESYLLQVHDFITGAVGDTVEGIGEKKDLYVTIEAKKRTK